MALEHALLVSLSERAASGAELTRRFDASIGFFWSATHQQIYRVLGRMEGDGWVERDTSRDAGKSYAVTDAGRAELARWIAEPTTPDAMRSSLSVKMRGASYGDRAALLEDLRRQLDEHTKRHSLYEFLAHRDFPDPAALSAADLDIYLVLRGGLLMEEFWIRWLTEYVDTHTTAATPPLSGPTKESR